MKIIAVHIFLLSAPWRDIKPLVVVVAIVVFIHRPTKAQQYWTQAHQFLQVVLGREFGSLISSSVFADLQISKVQ